jgi:hypothetical protein
MSHAAGRAGRWRGGFQVVGCDAEIEAAAPEIPGESGNKGEKWEVLDDFD